MLFKVKSADTVGMLAGKGVVIYMIAPCVAHDRILILPKAVHSERDKKWKQRWKDQCKFWNYLEELEVHVAHYEI